MTNVAKLNPYDVFLQQVAMTVLRALAAGIDLDAVARGQYEHLAPSPSPEPDISPVVRPAAPPARRPRRDRDPNYRLRVESITYLGDDVAAAHAIENFLQLTRSRARDAQ